MKNITQTRNFLFSGLSMVILLGVLSSCSSSKNTHYSDDGIYGTTPTQPQEEVVMVRDTRSDYYQSYFSGEKEYHEEIFTDIDSYQGYQDTDTVYVDDQYRGGYPPWEYSNSNVSVNFSFGFGGGWGWGYPCYGWGWGWSGYGWGYPCGGWGWGWGYPGWGWGPGWGYYPPYYPPYYHHYTYGKRYAHNTSRLNTRGVYNERSLSSRYNRSSSNYDRRMASNNYSRGRFPSSLENLGRSYQRSSRSRSGSGYNRSLNRGYNSGNYNRYTPRSGSYRGSRPSSGMSRGMSRGGMSRGGMSRGGMSRSSGRRNMSYIDLDNSPYGTNRTFVKRSRGVKDVVADNNGRISYSKARKNGNIQRTVRTNPAVANGNSGSGSYRGGTYGNVRQSSARSSGRSGGSNRSGSYSRSSSRSSSGSSFRSSGGGGSRSSGASRSGGSGRSSGRNR